MENNYKPSMLRANLSARISPEEIDLLEYVILWAESRMTSLPQIIVEAFHRRCCENKIKPPFTTQKYLSNEDIINTILALGFDVVKFWYLMLFIYDYINCLLSRGLFITDAVESEAAKDIVRQIENCEEGDIQILIKKQNKSIKIPKLGTRVILNMIKVGYENLYKDSSLTIYKEDMDERVNLSLSYKIYQAVIEYKHIFRLLTNKEKRQPIPAYSQISINKMLLISRIVYFYKWTECSKYLEDINSIKGVYNTYKGKYKTLPFLIAPDYYGY